MMTAKNDWREIAAEVLRRESETVAAQISHLDDSFMRICELLLSRSGHVVVTGLGKTGHIGSKIAATLASTGTPAFFLHAAEAGHGDLGMIRAEDTVLALSYSGESQELLTIAPIVRAMNVPFIAFTGRENSSLAKAADLTWWVNVASEACPLGLAPTTSTTAMLALGDALAVTLMRARDFREQDFARSHPYGRLGRRLLTCVSDVMRSGERLPMVAPQDSLQTALFQITEKGIGATLVVEDGALKGIFTDGDLRRALAKKDVSLTQAIANVMTVSAKITTPETLAAQALEQMEHEKITVLPVICGNKVVGVIHIHDLLAAGVS